MRYFRGAKVAHFCQLKISFIGNKVFELAHLHVEWMSKTYEIILK